MIEIKHLTKQYGGHIAVDNISLTVEKNEVLGLLGLNGAGKTTTMNMITGFISATSGTITIDGVDILQEPVKAKKQIGYLPDTPPLYKDMTVWEYLSFVFRLKKCRGNKKEQLEMICRRTGLTSVVHRLIGNLSRGYQQRVGIAQALAGSPPVLILDEPTVGLDPAQIVEFRDLIQSLGREHTVILSTHILPEAQLICNRIIMMHNGRLVAEDLAHGCGEGRNYRAEILGRTETVVSVLSAIGPQISVRPVGENQYLICQKGEEDLRKTLFYALVKEDLPLIGLHEERTSLEQAFLEIVMQNQSADGQEVLWHD